MKKYVIIIIVAVIIFLLVPPISLWIILSNVNLEKRAVRCRKKQLKHHITIISAFHILYTTFPIMIYVLAYSTQVKKYSMYGHLARYIMGQIWKSGWI